MSLTEQSAQVHQEEKSTEIPPATVGTNTNAYSSQKYNILAVISFIMALVIPFFLVVTFVLSLVSLHQIKKSGEKGGGLAIAALIISIVELLGMIVLVVLITMSIMQQTKIENDKISQLGTNRETYTAIRQAVNADCAKDFARSRTSTSTPDPYDLIDMFEVTVVKGDFAKGTRECYRSGTDGSIEFLAKKTRGNWDVIYVGTQPPTCKETAFYEVPTDIVANCRK